MPDRPGESIVTAAVRVRLDDELHRLDKDPQVVAKFHADLHRMAGIDRDHVPPGTARKQIADPYHSEGDPTTTRKPTSSRWPRLMTRRVASASRRRRRRGRRS